jgi:hypothetical protein
LTTWSPTRSHVATSRSFSASNRCDRGTLRGHRPPGFAPGVVGLRLRGPSAEPRPLRDALGSGTRSALPSLECACTSRRRARRIAAAFHGDRG